MTYLEFLKRFKKEKIPTQKEKKTLYFQQALINDYLSWHKNKVKLTNKGMQLINLASQSSIFDCVKGVLKHGFNYIKRNH